MQEMVTGERERTRDGAANPPPEAVREREARSFVPDLLFPDVRDARIARREPWFARPGELPFAHGLDRLTVFLTYACNLDCPYCKTIVRTPQERAERPHTARTIDLARFERILDGLAETPIDHVHFTGGEAALVPDLAALIAAAKRRGVRAVSLTSNGTRSPELYLGLVAAGLDELRLSIDAADSATGARQTGRTAMWERTVATIRTLAWHRSRGAPFFLILNTVIGAANHDRMPEILAFLLGLGPDDVKLILEVEHARDLDAAADPLRRRLEEVLARFPGDRFPLLRLKLRTVFSDLPIGLPRDLPESWRCYVPLSERTIDSTYYYPCSVYLREKGRPLGRIDEPRSAQRAKTAAFVKGHACGSDPICRQYCLRCTREFNEACNRERDRAEGALS